VDGVNHLQIFGRVTENPEKIRPGEKNPETIFGKICTRTPLQTRIIPNYPKTGQTLIKLPILRRYRNSGQ
jgi:hypothetical protein